MQKRGETCAFIDAEHALDPAYARTLGVDTENLLLSQPDFGEQALEIAEELAKTGAIKLIVIDSVAALVPRAEVEGDMGDSHMGLQARMMSQGLRKLTSIMAKTGTTIIFINQIRMKIGVMFGNPETTTGGNALKFYASQRLEIRRGEKIEENKELIGYATKVKVVKNKIAAPFRTAEIPIKFKSGIDNGLDTIEAATILGLIVKGGAFYTVPGKKEKIQGKDRLLEMLKQDDKLMSSLNTDIQNKIKEIRLGKNILPENALEEGMEDDDMMDDED